MFVNATIKQPVPIANSNQIHRVKQKPKLLKVNSEENFIRLLVCLITYLVVWVYKRKHDRHYSLKTSFQQNVEKPLIIKQTFFKLIFFYFFRLNLGRGSPSTTDSRKS
jgi:hypothetical protein